jgi:hypothetical protein
MSFLIQAVATYAPWIYAACGLIAMYQLYRIWLVRGERRQAVFSLEREKATRDLYRVFYVAMILVMIMGATYFFGNTLATAVEPLVFEALQPTPELPFMPTPTNTPLPSTPTPTITPTLLPTSEPTVVVDEAEVTAVPAATPQPVIQAPTCPDNRSLLLRPGNNEVVRGGVTIVGTANHDAFQYYKVEYAPGANADGGYGYLAGGNSPVVNGVLGSFDSNALGNGVWTLQLIVVDQTGNFPQPCKVTITVQN